MSTDSDSTEFEIEAGRTYLGGTSAAYEVGADDDGNAYVELELADGERYRFPTEKGAIKDAVHDRAEKNPGPQPPEGHDETIQGPDGWGEGRLVHTGGGIYNRIWQKELEEGYIEVGYNVPECRGATAEVYDDSDHYLRGNLVNKGIPEGSEETDENAAELAREIMNEIDAGEHDTKIEELLSD